MANLRKGKGLEIIDMNDRDVYGGEFYRLSFKKAVSAKRLSDYRVIALGIHHECVPPGLLRWLKESENKTSMLPSISDMARVLGVSLAVNGVSEGSSLERPGRLYRTLAFANTIARSEWYMDALKNPQVLGATTRRMGDDAKAMSVTATHLDARSSALERNRELRELSKAEKSGACRILGNVRLFTEGVDVPSLDAVAFLDPRDSQVDVVQAVGRVMRKADGKRFGYIIIPLVIPPGQDIVQALESGTEGYDTIGRVLRALQAHDSRLAESPTDFIMAYEIEPKPPGNGNGKPGEIQLELDFQECEQAIYAHVVAASGLGKPGQTVADEIVSVVRGIGGVLQREADVKQLARALLIAETDDAGKAISTIAALMLCNACLLHRRLRSEKVIQDIPDLGLVSGAESPREVLAPAWKEILSRDYKPVFRPALAVLEVLPPSQAIDDSIRTLSECANGVGDSLSDLGYDHAGPLYHRILGSAKSDGAFYTNNLSAVMLSRLAFTDDFIDWSDPEAVASLRIMDPACGSGTLLMAVLQTIKYRVAEHTKEGSVWEPDELHRYLVEDVFCGLDINPHAVQLAACNMTLGAPTVDYSRMNLATLPHGPQEEGGARAGSLDILIRETDDLASLFPDERSLKGLGADQVNEGTDIHFPLHNLDAVIMNPPFTANENRSKKYGDGGRKAMQARELSIKKQLGLRDPGAGSCITANSIGTFFNPLADQFIRDSKGVLAMVIPTTACTGAGAAASRKFLSERFHIKTIVTSHDPGRPNFSENTGIHESLLICRRRTEGMLSQPSHFIALRRMPKTPEEAINVVKMIKQGHPGKWFTVYKQPERLIQTGDWRPCQFLDPELVNASIKIEEAKGLIQLQDQYKLGPAGQRIRDAFRQIDDDGRRDPASRYRVFWGRSKDLRTTMEAEPEQLVEDKKPSLASRYKEQAGYILLAAKFNTSSGRLLSIFSGNPSLGSMWVPIRFHTTGIEEAKALCAWFNGTVGVLGFLMRRGSTLANPTFSQAQLVTLPVPDFSKKSTSELVQAFERTKHMVVKPWKEAEEDEMRDCLDCAAAATTGIDIEMIREWRTRISQEPTICNKPSKWTAKD